MVSSQVFSLMSFPFSSTRHLSDGSIGRDVRNAHDPIGQGRIRRYMQYRPRKAEDLQVLVQRVSIIDQAVGVGAALIPVKKAKGMVAQMAVKMNSGLPKSHDVNKHSHAAWELANFIDGKKTMLEIAHAVIAECGGPMPEKSAEFFYGLEKNGVIELKKK